MKNHSNKAKWLQVAMVVCGLAALTFLAHHYEHPDIQINSVEEIVIPGVEGEYEFLFLTDLHLAIKTREDVGPFGNADDRIAAFSNIKGTVSSKHLPQWVDYANKKEFDAVLMGGDIIDYYSDANAAYLSEYISKLKMPCLFTLGNHELFSPWEEAVPAESVIYDFFKEKNTAFQTIEFEEFVICAIDNETYQVNPESLTAMQDWLAANPDKPMILLAHVPFYTENDRALLETSVSVWGQALVIGTGEGTRDTTGVSREFLDLILAEDGPVVAIFTGDNHFYHKGNLTDSVTQWVGAPAYAGDGMVIRVKGNED
ncbi:MAG: metallophosphoesterase [Roseburia sp.]|nr:metallophosphoesterase [Roseburia sp.]